MIQRLYKPIMIGILLLAGIAHFTNPEEFAPAIPHIFPETMAFPLVYFTGIVELIAVVGLLIPKLQRLTAYLLTVYFISILPAHFEMIIIDAEIFGVSGRGFFIFRVFLQLVPIFISWELRKTNTPSIVPILDTIEEKLQARWAQPYAWHSKWLWAAAWYNLAFGYWVVIYPTQAFELFGMAMPTYPFIWQSVGMIVGVYGIGYGLAAFDEQKEWIIVMVGWLGKIFGPIGFIYTLALGEIPLAFGTLLLFNDLIWYPSFFGMMIRKFKSFKT